MLRILGTTEKRALVHFAPPPPSLCGARRKPEMRMERTVL